MNEQSQTLQEDVRPPEDQLLKRAKEQRRERVPGRRGSAPVSNHVQRFFFALLLFGGVGLSILDAWQIPHIKNTNRVVADAWLPGFWVCLVMTLCMGMVVLADSRGWTARALLAQRRLEKRILLVLGGVITLVWLLLAIFWPRG